MEIQELKKDKEKILYSCECCKYSSFMKRDYNVHLATKKHEKLSQGLSTRKDFFCDQCSYNSKYWSNVEKHKLSHMKRKKRAALNEIVEIERQLRAEKALPIEIQNEEILYQLEAEKKACWEKYQALF